MKWLPACLFLFLIASGLSASEPISGWRGNQTGLWPDANPPLSWKRKPIGALDELRATADWPKDKEVVHAPHVAKGLIRDWLVVGPFAVEDSAKNFDQDFLGGINDPTDGAKVGDKQWTKASVPPDDIMVFGTAELPWLDLGKVLGFKKNQIGYAHTWLYSPRGGPARIVVDHGHGLRVWLNGTSVYRSPQRGIGLGYYTALSRLELDHREHESPRFDIELARGWNRLLLKLSTSNKDDFKDFRCSLRIMDPPDVKYEEKNIE